MSLTRSSAPVSTADQDQLSTRSGTVHTEIIRRDLVKGTAPLANGARPSASRRLLPTGCLKVLLEPRCREGWQIRFRRVLTGPCATMRRGYPNRRFGPSRSNNADPAAAGAPFKASSTPVSCNLTSGPQSCHQLHRLRLYHSSVLLHRVNT